MIVHDRVYHSSVERECDTCDRKIIKGSPYRYLYGGYPRHLYTCRMCNVCMCSYLDLVDMPIRRRDVL